ncbi:MAG: hydroxysqualene dehydroxylase [Acidimicrobiales bacterium]
MAVRRLTRRGFLGGLGATGATAALRPVRGWATTSAASMSSQVAVLGGGVGGLSVAHELAERGLQVTVFEPKALGGKARSIPVAGTGTDGRRDLPGEHGFRFFPGFYKNSVDTMARIPEGGGTVLDHLLDASQEMFVLPSGQAWLLPSFDANGFEQGIRSVITAVGLAASVPPNEIEYLVRKMLVFQTSSDARRVGQWDNVSWWDFVNAGRFSPTYQQVFGNGLTKTLVAAKGTKASARTIALVGLALIYSMMSHNNPLVASQSGYGAADRLLDAPTNEAWIDPWVAHLRSLGVTFVQGYAATKLRVDGGRIASATLTDDNGNALEVRADHYVAAMPVERARALFDPAVRAAAPELAALDLLEYDFMNGIQFFLNRMPTQAVHGHVAFLSSPWALTSINQGVFWNRDLASTYGDGRLHDILSVDISDFFTPGILYGKAAVDCTPDEIAAECWAQIKAGLNSPGDTQLSDDMLLDWFLDPALVFGNGPATSTEPLLINTPGALAIRPDAATSIPNLFLAADYVRCDVDLATMEGANEAARAAANAILDAAGSSEPRVPISRLWESPTWDINKSIDEQQYRMGLPNLLDVIPAAVPL